MTEDELADYIKKTWGKLGFEVKVREPLRNLFPRPKNRALLSMWKYGHADVAVFKNGKLIAILEPGGVHHFDEEQRKRDEKKYRLCKQNSVKCLFFVSSLPERVSKRKFRNMIRKVLFER